MTPKPMYQLPCGSEIKPDRLLMWIPDEIPDERRGFERRRDAQSCKQVWDAFNRELEYLDSGVYGKFVRTPEVPSPVFRMSPICPHLFDRGNNDCSTCVLWAFVPPEWRQERIPCHYIPLDDHGANIHELSFGPQREVENAVRGWLKATINQMGTAA